MRQVFIGWGVAVKRKAAGLFTIYFPHPLLQDVYKRQIMWKAGRNINSRRAALAEGYMEDTQESRGRKFSGSTACLLYTSRCV